MKSRLNIFLVAILGVCAAISAHAQQQPVLDVKFTSIDVVSGSSGVTAVAVTTPGTGYSTAPTVVISGGGGTGAVYTANVAGGSVTGFNQISQGSGYTSAPLVTLTGGGGTGATATATVVLTTNTFSLTTGPNEAYGAWQNRVDMFALARGTFPLGGFTYTFFINGNSVGSPPNIPNPSIPNGISWAPPAPGVYFFTVHADGSGPSADSLPVRYFATGAIINSPQSPTVVPDGSSVVIKADATTQQGFIQKIDFYVDGVLAGSDATYPYSLIYAPSGSTGTTHSLTVQATDNNGNVLISPAVTLQMTAHVGSLPTSVIATPLDGATISIPDYVLDSTANIPINVQAGASPGTITKVETYIDGILVNTDVTFPYSFAWRPTVVGTYRITALSFDDKNNVVSSLPSIVTVTTGGGGGTVIGLPPIVAVTSPTTGSSSLVATPVTLSASASDPDGIVTSVQFFVNGVAFGAPDTTFPYTTTWTPNALGTYNITAKVIDNSGNTVTSSAVALTVGAGSPPVVTLINPDSNLSVAVGSTINLAATAGSATGTVTGVRFLVNNNPVATVTTAPYTATFTPTVAGAYSIVAEATNSSGLVTTSTPRVITAVSGPLSVFLLNPAQNTTIDTMSSLLITALASTSTGTISRVEFYAGTTLLATKTESPYSYIWNPTVGGAFVVRAVAYDSLGNSISSSGVTVTVNPTGTPRGTFTARLTNPTDGAVLRAFRNITFSATTNMAADSITGVDFYANGFLFDTATTAPYQVTRNPSVPGAFEFFAVVRGNGFALVTPSVRVTVLPNEAPTVAMTSPSSGTTTLVGNQLTLRASASDPDDQIDKVTFLVNGQVLSSSSTFPYTATWTPSSEGVYTINAIAKDNQGSVGGNESVSAPIYVRVVGSTTAGGVGGGNAVYAGTYLAGAESGRFAVISIDGKKATLIARSTSGTPKTYFYSDMTVDASGGFSLVDGTGKTVVSAATNESGTTGTFDGGRAFFIGSNVGFSPARGVVAGYYAGNLDGRLTSMIIAIVGADGTIMAYVRDGTFSDAADGKLDSSGSFNIVSLAGNRLTGNVEAASGFLTGTLTGVGSAPSGKFNGAVAAGATFSDGILRGLSTRGFVGTGNNILVAGFVINGAVPKRVMVRGLGPSMAGVSGTLADPQLQLFQSSGAAVAGGSNNNWSNDASTVSAMSQVGLAAPASSFESVVAITLAPGAYTAQLSGVGGTTGNALIELYDLDTAQAFTTQKVRALSTRGFVSGAGSELIAGFIVSGSIPKKVLVQAGGPAIAAGVSGTLSDPMLKIYRFTAAGAVLVRENDNWEVGNDGALVTNAINRSGATPFAAGSRDAAVLIDLPPGTYTAVVSGVGNTTGIAIVNTYEVP